MVKNKKINMDNIPIPVRDMAEKLFKTDETRQAKTNYIDRLTDIRDFTSAIIDTYNNANVRR